MLTVATLGIAGFAATDSVFWSAAGMQGDCGGGSLAGGGAVRPGLPRRRG